MATLQSDPTLAGFNCYASVAEADDYHSKCLHNTVWTTATSGNKGIALMWGTRLLDSLDWEGSRTDSAQLLMFPRSGLYMESTAMSETAIPLFLKETVSELAMQLIASDVTQASGTEGFSKIKVDTIELAVAPRDRPSWLTDSVRALCLRWLLNSNKYSAPVYRAG